MEERIYHVEWNDNRHFFHEAPRFGVRVFRQLTPKVVELLDEHGDEYEYMHRWQEDKEGDFILVIVLSNDEQPPTKAPYDTRTKEL